MSRQPLSAKDVFFVGEVSFEPTYKDVHFVLLQDPLESIKEHGDIMAALMYRGKATKNYESSFRGTHVINCMLRMPVEEVILRKYSKVDTLTEDEHHDALDAYAFALKKNYRFY